MPQFATPLQAAWPAMLARFSVQLPRLQHSPCIGAKHPARWLDGRLANTEQLVGGVWADCQAWRSNIRTRARGSCSRDLRSGRTQINMIMPTRNADSRVQRRFAGCPSAKRQRTPIRKGARNEVALPASRVKAKNASVIRAGRLVHHLVRLADCSAPPAAARSGPRGIECDVRQARRPRPTATPKNDELARPRNTMLIATKVQHK